MLIETEIRRVKELKCAKKLILVDGLRTQGQKATSGFWENDLLICVPGVGKIIVQKLARVGICQVKDFFAMNEDDMAEIRALLGPRGIAIKMLTTLCQKIIKSALPETCQHGIINF